MPAQSLRTRARDSNTPARWSSTAPRCRRSSRRVEARELLRRGMDLASGCAASALAGRAREELIAAGARPRRERISGADSLTASERRVALLAADGKTNREIADALFITINTVGKHLTHIYSKLDIADRARLAAALECAP